MHRAGCRSGAGPSPAPAARVAASAVRTRPDRPSVPPATGPAIAANARLLILSTDKTARRPETCMEILQRIPVTLALCRTLWSSPTPRSAKWAAPPSILVAEYYDTLAARAVVRPTTSADLRRLLDEPAPPAGLPFTDLLATVRDVVAGVQPSQRPSAILRVRLVPGPARGGDGQHDRRGLQHQCDLLAFRAGRRPKWSCCASAGSRRCWATRRMARDCW